MSEFPIIRQFVREAEQKTKHEDILRILKNRFGDVPENVGARIRRFRKKERLNALFDYAMECSDLREFRKRLQS